jgi:beta-1,4-mannosyl-glycoprotein beta-1,4-N-acetylglucosaminyltransferase
MVIDAFPFFNELDLLEIRLNELNSVVDYFLIVESLERHGSAKLKPAFLRDNWDIVKPFESKIKYVLLPNLEPPYTAESSGWQRENYQRNVIMNHVSALSTKPDEDILIVSDADEIPRASVLKANLPNIAKGRHRFVLELFFYNVNRFVGLSNLGAGLAMAGPVSAFQRDCTQMGLSQIRFGREILSLRDPLIANGGWHFSHFGGIARMRDKVSSIAEAYLDGAKAFCERPDAQIAAEVASGWDIYHRGIYPPFTWRETNDPNLPQHFLNNLDRYQHFTEAFLRQQHGL